MLEERAQGVREGSKRRFPSLARVERMLLALIPYFRRWASGKLPDYARRRADTGDIVQEALIATLRRLGELDSSNPEALRRYLQVAIANRIRDEIRRARRGEVLAGAPNAKLGDARPGPLEEAIEAEDRARYRAALLSLQADDQALLVGRIDLGLDYDELALVTGRRSAEAARAAARRAAFRLAQALGTAPRGSRSS